MFQHKIFSFYSIFLAILIVYHVVFLSDNIINDIQINVRPLVGLIFLSLLFVIYCAYKKLFKPLIVLCLFFGVINFLQITPIPIHIGLRINLLTLFQFNPTIKVEITSLLLLIIVFIREVFLKTNNPS